MLSGSAYDFCHMRSAMQAVYDAKSEEIGPGIYRFKAEIGESCNATLMCLQLQSHAVWLTLTSLQPWPMVHCMFIAFCFWQPRFYRCIRESAWCGACVGQHGDCFVRCRLFRRASGTAPHVPIREGTAVSPN